MSSVPYEKIVAEDLHLGTADVTVTMPAGGTAVGHAINLATFQALAFAAGTSTTQLVPSSTTTIVQYPVEEFDTKGWYDPVTHKFTPMKAGYYLATGSVFIAAYTGRAILTIYKNAQPMDYIIAVRAGDVVAMQISVLCDMNGTTDNLYMQIHNDDPVARIITGGRFTGVCVGGL